MAREVNLIIPRMSRERIIWSGWDNFVSFHEENMEKLAWSGEKTWISDNYEGKK